MHYNNSKGTNLAPFIPVHVNFAHTSFSQPRHSPKILKNWYKSGIKIPLQTPQPLIFLHSSRKATCCRGTKIFYPLSPHPFIFSTTLSFGFLSLDYPSPVMPTVISDKYSHIHFLSLYHSSSLYIPP